MAPTGSSTRQPRRAIHDRPPRGPDEPHGAARGEHPAPAAVQQDRGNRRRGDDRAGGGSGVDDPHRGRSFSHGEPLRNHLRCGRKPAAFTEAQQKAADREHSDARGERMTCARDRPEDHDRDEAPARAEPIDQRAAAGIHEGVRQQKQRREIAELCVGEGNVALDRRDGHGQRLAIEIADRDRCAHEPRHAPASRHSVPHFISACADQGPGARGQGASPRLETRAREASAVRGQVRRPVENDRDAGAHGRRRFRRAARHEETAVCGNVIRPAQLRAA